MYPNEISGSSRGSKSSPKTQTSDGSAADRIRCNCPQGKCQDCSCCNGCCRNCGCSNCQRNRQRTERRT